MNVQQLDGLRRGLARDSRAARLAARIAHLVAGRLHVVADGHRALDRAGNRRDGFHLRLVARERMILVPCVELVAQLARLVRLAEQAENRARAAQRAAQRGRAVSACAVREHARVQLVVRIAVFLGQQLDNRRHSARAAAAVRVEALIAVLHNRVLVQLLVRPRPGRRFHALGQRRQHRRNGTQRSRAQHALAGQFQKLTTRRILTHFRVPPVFSLALIGA